MRVRLKDLFRYLAGQDAQRTHMQRELIGLVVYPLVFLPRSALAPIAYSCVVRQDDQSRWTNLGRTLVQRGARNLLLIRQKVRLAGLADREKGIRDICHRTLPDRDYGFVWTTDEDPGHISARLQGGTRKTRKPDAVLPAHDQLAIASPVRPHAGISVPRDL